jgi:hypothetical protein
MTILIKIDHYDERLRHVHSPIFCPPVGNTVLFAPRDQLPTCLMEVSFDLVP